MNPVLNGRLYRLVNGSFGFAIHVALELDERIRSVVYSPASLETARQLCGSVWVNTDRHWGFGGALRREEREDGVYYHVTFLNNKRRAIVLSLNRFYFEVQELFLDVSADDPRRPLVGFGGFTCIGGNSGWDMGMELSPAMRDLLPRFDIVAIERVLQKMKDIGIRLGCHESLYHFWVSPVKFVLEVPGEATTLGESWHSVADRGHCTLGGHNIDFSHQQLALLTGAIEAGMIAEDLERGESERSQSTA